MISFDISMANDWRQLLQKLARDFEECEHRLSMYATGLSVEVAARSDIDNRLVALHKKARQIRENIETMANLLFRAETTYADADRQTAEMVHDLVEQWCGAERAFAPIISRINYGLTATDVEKIDAVRSLDGLFMPTLQMNSENRTAYFKPLNIEYRILSDGD